MDAYLTVVYPAVLAVCAALTLAGLVTLVWVPAHRALQWVVTATYVVVVLQAGFVLYGLVTVDGISIPTTLGYFIATLALLPLLGIGRLGEPHAAATDPDPNRPVLQPDQVARVDAGAAIIVAIALAVASWRITVIFGA